MVFECSVKRRIAYQTDDDQATLNAKQRTG